MCITLTYAPHDLAYPYKIIPPRTKVLACPTSSFHPSNILVNLFCTLSSLITFFIKKGNQNSAQYCKCGLTNVLYNVTFQLLTPCPDRWRPACQTPLDHLVYLSLTLRLLISTIFCRAIAFIVKVLTNFPTPCTYQNWSPFANPWPTYVADPSHLPELDLKMTHISLQVQFLP